MGPSSDDVERAVHLMRGFAEQTGLRGEGPNRRYLWTDAFALCNFRVLWQSTLDDAYRELAFELVERVHETLGRFREDDARRGWISGLDETEGRMHPTRGGLRIGKPLPEREPGAMFDPELEWERDGQYFHYLTKWMLALDQLSRATRDARSNLWARELAEAAHRGFMAGSRSAPHLYWKMSTDLSRPLVSSRGQHDALDGFVTAELLRDTAAALRSKERGPDLQEAVRDLSRMLEQGELATTDPLGLGELLCAAARTARLTRRRESEPRLLFRLLSAAREGLSEYEYLRPLAAPAHRRLAFRELGLAIGLAAIEVTRQELEAWPGEARARGLAALEDLERFVPLGATIRSFWLDLEHRKVTTWVEHRAIIEVMLATSLMPDGYLS